MTAAPDIIPLPVPQQSREPLSRFAVAYLAGTFLAFLVALLFGGAVHVELFSPKPSIMGAAVFARLDLLRAVLLAFGVALPSFIGLGHLALPKSESLSGPGRLIVTALDALAAGLFALAALALVVACVTTEWSSLLASAAMGAVASAAAAFQSIAFLLRLRAPDDKTAGSSNLARSVWLTSGVGAVILPVCALFLSLLVAEHLAHIVGWHDAGGNPQRYAYWLRVVVTGVPYLAIVPCLGAVSDVFGARPSALLGPLAAITLFGAAVWAAQTLGGDTPGAIAVQSFFSLAVLVPALLVAYEWLAAIRGENAKGPPLWLGVTALLLFFELAMTGAALGMADVGRVLRGGTFTAAHADLLLVGIIFAIAADVDRRSPLTRTLRIPLVACFVALVGVSVAVGSEALAGVSGMPSTIDYPPSLRTVSTVAGVGWFVLIVGAGLLAAHFVDALRRAGEKLSST